MEDKKYKSISVKNAKKIIFYFTSRLLFMILAIIFITYGCSLFVHADDVVSVDYGSMEFTSVSSAFPDSELFTPDLVRSKWADAYGTDNAIYNSTVVDSGAYLAFYSNNNQYVNQLYDSDLPIPSSISADRVNAGGVWITDVSANLDDSYIFVSYGHNNNDASGNDKTHLQKLINSNKPKFHSQIKDQVILMDYAPM